jgi:PKD repeat protein
MKKKNYLFLLIIALFNCFSLSAQWVDKGNHWELSDKIPNVRDMKIFPEENLIITVSKDNTIRFIEYDSGKIIKTNKPIEITEDNDFAKISDDGKTTVVVKHLPKYPDYYEIYSLQIILINNETDTLLCEYIFNTKSLEHNYADAVDSFNCFISYFEYLSVQNKLNIFINFHYDFRIHADDYYNEYGFQFFGNVQKKKYIILDTIKQSSVNDVINFGTNNDILISNIYTNGYFGKYNQNNDHYCNLLFTDHYGKIKDSLYSTYYSSENKKGELGIPDYGKISGVYLNINQIFKSNNPDIYYLLTDNDIIDFNIKTKKIINRLEIIPTHETAPFKLIELSRDGNFIHYINKNTYTIAPKLNLQAIYQFKSDSNFSLSKPVVDFQNGKVLLADNSNRIIMLKPDIMTSIDSNGFYWNKSKIYIGESIDFYALSNKSGCKYEWEFTNGFISQSITNKITHKYDKPGIYGVTLTIRTPEGKTYTFKKDSIITVLDSLKADFDFEILGNEMPLKVRFTDKSKGTINYRRWDFGDGKSSDQQNIDFSYKYKGAFSVNLRVNDGLSTNEITKYDTVIVGVDKPIIEAKNTLLEYKYKEGTFAGAFLTSTGFNFNYKNTYYGPFDWCVDLFVNSFDISRNLIDTSLIHLESDNYKAFDNLWINIYPNDKLLINFDNYDSEGNILLHDLKSKINSRFSKNEINGLKVIKITGDKNIFWVKPMGSNDEITITKTDLNFNIISKIIMTDVPSQQIFADTIDNGLHLVAKNNDSSYQYLNVSKSNANTLNLIFKLKPNMKLSNIKTIDKNTFLLYGSLTDSKNNTSYAYLAKYDIINNKITDTILYSRYDIKTIEKISNLFYAAIGQSRGRQGYLILDSNLNQIKDIRSEDLIGKIDDILINNDKVYLFTEKIASLPILALGFYNSNQTTASVLGIPQDILLSIEEKPVLKSSDNNFTVFPNPATDYIEIQPSEGWQPTEGSDIQIFDLLGIPVSEIHPMTGSHRMNIENLTPGIYFIKIGNKLEKFVKM